MAANLYLHLSPDLTWVQWQLQQASELIQGNSRLDQLRDDHPEFAGVATQLWWPGQSASLLPVRIPQGQARQLNRLLPFALEEYLASDLDQVHFVPSSQLDQGQLWVSVVDKPQFEQVLAHLQTAEVRLLSVELDVLALSRLPEPLLCVDTDLLWLAHPQLRSVGEQDMQLMLLSQLPLAEAATLHLYRTAQDDQQPLQQQLLALGYRLELTEIDSCLSLLRQTKRSPLGNLLSGPYSQKQHQSLWQQLPLKPLGSAAAMLLAAFSLWSLSSGLQNQQRVKAYEQATEQLFTQLFPEQRFVRARYRQDLDSLLRQAGQGGFSGFIPLLALASEHLPLNQGQIETVRYNDGRDELLLTLRSQNIAALEEAQSALRLRGIEVEFSLVQDQQSSIGSYIIRGDR